MESMAYQTQILDIFQELIEKLHKGELSKDEYPCLNDPSQTFHGTSQTAAVNHAPVSNPAQSKRTHKWARPRNSDDGYSRCYFDASLTWV